MKQLFQSLRDGSTDVVDVPCPSAKAHHLVIRTSKTLVSPGTERMLVEFGKAGWIAKARQQPDKVRAVIDKIKTDGLAPTLEAVFAKLEQPLPLGYCSVGTVVEVGPHVTGFAVGDRVASNGNHAEYALVPATLCAKVPASVSDDEASFTVLAAIALQGIRLAAPTLGETVAVFGLGLIGLLAVQLLRANGCHVIGLDFAADRLALARTLGAHTIDLRSATDPLDAALHMTDHRGIDAAVITASTASSEPVHQAARMCRKRGRIVLVGVTGLELSRADFYEKELSFQVSCSYGPGRYDPAYEQRGVDYPLGFVRWTEQRNFEAVLGLLAERQLRIEPLVSHRFPFAAAADAYSLITSESPSLGVILEYPSGAAAAPAEKTVPLPARGLRHPPPASGVRIACIGAGNYASRVLMPAFRAAGAQGAMVASQGGVSAVHAGRKHGFAAATTDLDAVFQSPDIDSVVIATRHDSHAALVARGLRAGKHVFVEKPVSLSSAGLDDIIAARSEAAAAPLLMVGFNRRFSPLVVKLRSLLARSPAPKSFVMTVNAGAVDASHWTQDLASGGGRIAGEACHFIDLLRHLAGSPFVDTGIVLQRSSAGPADSAVITCAFEDGSIGAIHYLANGSRDFPKERLEVFSSGRVFVLDNFRSLVAYGCREFSRLRLWQQDKGQQACVRAFLDAIEAGGESPIPFAEIVEVGRATISLAGTEAAGS